MTNTEYPIGDSVRGMLLRLSVSEYLTVEPYLADATFAWTTGLEAVEVFRRIDVVLGLAAWARAASIIRGGGDAEEEIHLYDLLRCLAGSPRYFQVDAAHMGFAWFAKTRNSHFGRIVLWWGDCLQERLEALLESTGSPTVAEGAKELARQALHYSTPHG